MRFRERKHGLESSQRFRSALQADVHLPALLDRAAGAGRRSSDLEHPAKKLQKALKGNELSIS